MSASYQAPASLIAVTASAVETLPPRRLYKTATAVFAVLLVLLTAAIWGPGLFSDPTASLRDPSVAAARMMTRHLEFYEGARKLHWSERAFYGFLFGSRQQVLEDGVVVYQDVLRHFKETPTRAESWSLLNTRVRLAILLAELGRVDEARTELAILDEDLEGAAMAAAVRFAYDIDIDRIELSDAHVGAGYLPSGWARDRLRIRFAEKTGAWWAAKRIKLRLLANGELRRDRLHQFTTAVVGFLFAGLCVIALWLYRRRLPAPFTARMSPVPWTLGEGLAVFVRSGVFGLIILLLLIRYQPTWFGFDWTLWGTLLASLPMLWFIRQYLLKPHGLGFVAAFGLRPPRGRGLEMVAVMLAVIAADMSGTLAINWSIWKLGFVPHWADGINERWIWAPLSTSVFSGIDAVAWASIFEEIGFRGLLYLTLRTRLSPVTAAVISSGLFSITHMNSLATSLAFFWSGLVWCYAVERFRSLLPAIAAHATGNVLAVSTVFLFYR